VDNSTYPDYNFNKYIKDEIYVNLCDTIDYEEFNEIYDKNIEDIYINNKLFNKYYKYNHHLFDNYLTENIIQIDKIKNMKQPEQKSEEWYKFRKNHITGSNAWKIFTTESAYNQLMYEKLLPDINSKNSQSLDDDTPFNWGHKYEPISIKLYEYYNDVIVEEFGCIQHESIEYLAASPDGIVTSKKNNGRMLEIKNPISRDITKIPKMDYYVQMQIQMEVCNLPDCDFVETKFIQYDKYNDFKNDKYKIEKGMIILILSKKDNKLIYEYSNLFKNNETELDIFTNNIYNKYNFIENLLETDDHKWIKNVYWKLDIYSCIYVPRNKKWFNSIKDKLDIFWNNVEKERNEEESYKKFSPKKKNKINKEIINLNNNEC
jgi:putative phage-type endonuclease